MKLSLYEFAGFTNGALQMTRRLRMSISQKLASWKGSAEDAKADQKPPRTLRSPRLIIRVIRVHSWMVNPKYEVRILTYEKISFFCKTKPISEKVK